APEVEALELRSRPALDVAGEEPLQAVLAAGERLERGDDSRERAERPARRRHGELGPEVLEVAREHARAFLGRGLHAAAAEAVVDDRGIGAPGHGHVARRVLDAVELEERALDGAAAGARRGDERAVYVPEDDRRRLRHPLAVRGERYH